MAVRYMEIGLSEDFFEDLSLVHVEMEKLIPESHEFVLKFIDYNLGTLEHLLTEYLSCLKTGKPPRKQLLSTIIRELRQMHPFFLLCNSNAADLLNTAIAGYITNCFSETGEFVGPQGNKRTTTPSETQAEMFRRVCVPKPSFTADPDTMFPGSSYAGDPYILNDLYRLQRDIRTWVFLTMDNSNPQLAVLTSEQRSALYAFVTAKEDLYAPHMRISSEYSVEPSKRMREERIKWDFRDLDEDYDPDRDDSDYAKLDDALDALACNSEMKLPAILEDVIRAVKDVDDCEIITYKINSFKELLEFEVYSMIREKIRIRRCRNCNRYFIPDRSNQEYCNYIAPNSTKLCSDIGHSRVYTKKMLADNSPEGLYRKAYKAHHQRLQRETMTEEEFTEWKKTALEKKELVSKNELDPFEFQEWLKI